MTALHAVVALLVPAQAGPSGPADWTQSLHTSLVAAGAVCPVAPGNAQQYVDEITGYILWGVLALFTIGMLIGIGAILAGRIFGMPHASKAGVVSIVIIFVAGIGYLVLPGMINGFMGTGCISAAPTTGRTTDSLVRMVSPPGVPEVRPRIWAVLAAPTDVGGVA